MSVLPIRFFPDPVLRKPCEKVEKFDQNLAQIIKNLFQTMKSQPHGIGIAAPQVGIAKQIAIVDVSARVPGAERLVLINPQILDLNDEKASREGCMSLPNYMGNLKRYERVTIQWHNEKGELLCREFCGIEAVCIQHEVDHLNGKLFIDRVTSLKRDLIPRESKSK